MDNPEEILRTRVEGLFGGVFPEFSNCALVEFTTPAGGHQQVQHVVFAGGCEDLDWTLSVLFDAMGAMSSNYNDTPARASRASFAPAGP